jgi:hypothetical protein
MQSDLEKVRTTLPINLKRKRSASLMKTQPDYVAYVKTRLDLKYDIFVAEVKKPYAKANQLESDLVKVGKQMKKMIDCLLDLDIEQPIVCGLVIEGKIT